MSAVREGTYIVPRIGTLISKADLGMTLLSVVQKMVGYDHPTDDRKKAVEAFVLVKDVIYRFQRRFLRFPREGSGSVCAWEGRLYIVSNVASCAFFPRVIRTSSACPDDSSDTGSVCVQALALA